MKHEPYAWILRDYNSTLDTIRDKTRMMEADTRTQLKLGPRGLAEALEDLAARVYTSVGESEGTRQAKATALAAAHTAILVILALDREGGPANVWEQE